MASGAGPRGRHHPRLKAGETVPFQPWAEALFKERRANNTRDDPTAKCVVGGVPRSDFVGYPFKILERPGMVVILYEAVHSYRQIFTDGRALPKDPNPTGSATRSAAGTATHSSSRRAGFNDNVWLDNAGRPATELLRVTERFVRKDFGQMDIEITIDDPKAYTKPWIGHATARVSARHRAARIHLQREQQVLRDHSEAPGR